MTNNESILKRWIDNATYSQLLERWRHAPSGDHMFEGNVGNYYADNMAEKKRLLSIEDQVIISKQVGWS